MTNQEYDKLDDNRPTTRIPEHEARDSLKNATERAAYRNRARRLEKYLEDTRNVDKMVSMIGLLGGLSDI